MSNAIAPLASLLGPEPVAPTGARASVKSGADAVPTETTPTHPALGPNPSLRIDEALGIIVMQLRDASGKVASTIPTAQQLNAYRRSLGNAGAQPALGGTAQTITGNPASAAAPGVTSPGTPGTGATAPASAAQTASPVGSTLTTPTTG